VPRFEFSLRGFSLSRSAGLLGISLMLSACGGGSPPPQQSPVQAVQNGSSLASASSHWVSKSCALQAEIASNDGFLSIVTDTAGDTTTASLTWAAGTNGNSLTVTGSTPGGLQGAFWIASMTSISGSVASQQFTADVTVQTQDTPQNLGTCSFVLTQGGLALPAVQ
jgi:hypothetical protein